MKILYHLKVKFVLFFKICFFSLGLVFSQPEITFFSKNNIEVIDSLKLALNNKNSLTGIYKLKDNNFSSDTLIYQYYQESKLIDTLFVFGLNNISDKIKSKLINEYKTISIDNNFNNIGRRIRAENYFISNEPKYIFGRTKMNLLGLQLYFDTQFHSYFSGNFGLSKNLNNFNLNGEINLHLENLIKSTGLIDIKWVRTDSLYQIINFNIFEPYILNTNFGINWEYYYGLINGLYSKKENRIYIDFFFHNFSNFQIGYLAGKNIPTKKGKINNYKKIKFEGISILYEKNLLNDRFLPISGYFNSINIDFGLNNKSIFINNKIIFQKLFPITNKIYNSLKWTAEGISILHGKVPRSSYKYFGGSTSLRGFNDNQFSSPQFNITSLEFRYILNTNFHGLFFFDFGSKKINFYDDNIIGYGIGIKKVNESTILNFAYAINNKYNMLFDGKLHIEVISRF